MSMQTSAATGPNTRADTAAAVSVVMDTYGASFARRYYAVMTIFAWLVGAQAGSCQPLT